jgi:hypothetical protein
MLNNKRPEKWKFIVWEKCESKKKLGAKWTATAAMSLLLVSSDSFKGSVG